VLAVIKGSLAICVKAKARNKRRKRQWCYQSTNEELGCFVDELKWNFLVRNSSERRWLFTCIQRNEWMEFSLMMPRRKKITRKTYFHIWKNMIYRRKIKDLKQWRIQKDLREENEFKFLDQ
jgi:hypothetical protein